MTIVYKEIFLPLSTFFSTGKFKTGQISLVQIISFETQLCLGKFKTGKTLCKWRKAKITTEKNNPVYSIWMFTSLQNTHNVPDTIIQAEIKTFVMRSRVMIGSLTFLGGFLMTSWSTGSTPRLQETSQSDFTINHHSTFPLIRLSKLQVLNIFEIIQLIFWCINEKTQVNSESN